MHSCKRVCNNNVAEVHLCLTSELFIRSLVRTGKKETYKRIDKKINVTVTATRERV